MGSGANKQLACTPGWVFPAEGGVPLRGMAWPLPQVPELLTEDQEGLGLVPESQTTETCGFGEPGRLPHKQVLTGPRVQRALPGRTLPMVLP